MTETTFLILLQSGFIFLPKQAQTETFCKTLFYPLTGNISMFNILLYVHTVIKRLPINAGFWGGECYGADSNE